MRNSFLIGSATVAAAAFGVFQSAYVVRTLGGEWFGKLVLLQTTWQTLVLLTNFGTQANGMYLMAVSIGSADREKAADSLSYLMKGILLSSALAVLGSAILAPFLPGYVGMGKEVSLCFVLLGVMMIFATPRACAVAIAQAHRKMKLFAGMLVLNAGVLALCTVLLTHYYGVSGALVAPGLAAVVSAPWYAWYVRRAPAAAEGFPTLLRRRSLRPNIKEGIWMAMDKGIAGFYSVIPYHLVNGIYGPVVTGSLRIASRLCELSAIPQNAITTNSQSQTPVEWARGNAVAGWKVFWRNIGLGSAVAIFFSVVLLLFGGNILGLIYGPTGASSAYLIPALIPFVLVTALGPMGIMYRLLKLVPRVVVTRGILFLVTTGLLYMALPSSEPSFAGLAGSAFHVVPAGFVFWMILRRKTKTPDMASETLPVLQTIDGE